MNEVISGFLISEIPTIFFAIHLPGPSSFFFHCILVFWGRGFGEGEEIWNRTEIRSKRTRIEEGSLPFYFCELHSSITCTKSSTLVA